MSTEDDQDATDTSGELPHDDPDPKTLPGIHSAAVRSSYLQGPRNAMLAGIDLGPQVSGINLAASALESLQPPTGFVRAMESFNQDLSAHASTLSSVASTLESLRAPLFEAQSDISKRMSALWSPTARPLDHIQCGPLSNFTGAAHLLPGVRPSERFLRTVDDFNRRVITQAGAVGGVIQAMESAARISVLDPRRFDGVMAGLRSRSDSPLAGLWPRQDSPIAGIAGRVDLIPGITGVMKALNAAQGALFDYTKVASTVWAGMDHASFMEKMMGGQTDALLDTLRGWSARADRGMWAAGVALRMALRAVKAVQRGDIAEVKKFMRDWLGFTIFSWDLINSASLVLLDVTRWLPAVPGLDFDPRPKLRKLVLAENRRVTRQLTDPVEPALRLNGQSLLSLDKPVKVRDDGAVTTLGNLRPDPAAIDPSEAYAYISDPRVLKVWSKFTDRERTILHEKGKPRTSWASAAVACGGTPAEGERLARKVRYLRRKGAGQTPPVEVAV
jgi:hypothetical protein